MAYEIWDERLSFSTDDQTGDTVVRQRLDFILDSAADVANLPGIDKVRMGSTAYDPPTGDIYILLSTGVWTKKGGE